MQLIAADYWLPWRAFNLGYPWLTPGAIARLDELVKPDWTVLELGAGGSTVWFSKRCAAVTSFETSGEIRVKLTQRLAGANVALSIWGDTEAEQVRVLQAMPELFDLVLLDSAPGQARRSLLPLTWRLAREMLVVDNYANCGLTHQTLPPGWTMEAYDDIHWQGWGTAVVKRMEAK